MGEKVKENNEAISLQSQDGLGFANSSLAQNSIAPTGLDSAKKNLNIILIEDSEDEAMLLVNELKEAGFTLNFERTNSISGFEKLLDSSKWDCVIADHSMPSGRALSALKIFRKRDADIPFIILVGTVIDEDAVNAIKNGANDYILKDRRQRLIPAIERELREAEIRRKQRADDRMLRELNVAVEQTADGIVISNLDGVIRFANRACAEMHGLPIDEIIGRNISIFHTKEQFETGVAPLKDHVLQSASRTAKIGHVRKDGTIFFSWMSCTFLTDKNKTPNGFIFIARNLSEHKLEQEIVRLNETLEMEIEERVTELSLANAKIENLLTAASEVSIIATNNEGLITVFNPGSEKMLGYSASEVVGKQTPESFHLRIELEQRSAELSRLVGKTIKGFDVFAAIPRREGSELREWTYVRKDGTHFAVQLAITPMRSVDGEITGYLGIGTDLTRLKKAQEEIGELSRKNEMLLNAAGAGIYGVDIKQKTTFVNPSAIKMLGFSADELLGRCMHDLIHHTRIDGSKCPKEKCKLYSTLLNGKPYCVIDEVFWRKDGTSFPVEYSINPIAEDGKVIGAVIDFRDITVLKQQQELINKTNIELFSIINSAPVAIISMGLDEMILTWNRAAEKIFGWEKEEIVGKSIFMMVSEDQLKDFKDGIEQVKVKETIMFKDIVARKKDGTAMKGSLNLTPMLDSAGNVTALLAIILDVTEQKAMETQFYQAQKMDVVGKLTGGIAHDFNNMLAVILGDGEILQGLLKEQPDNRACADEIVKAGKKAALLTKQLLAFSRQAVLSPILLDLNVQIAEMEQMLKRLVGEHIKISMVFPPEPVMVYFGPSRLDQVIMNLVVNARDAMSSGGYINIKVSRISIEKDLEIYNSQKIIPGNYAVIEVSDTGTGIAPEVKAKIFAPFFTTKEAGKGTGLGLSVVHDIVCKSGGFIDIDTVLDKGSTFKIYLKSLDQKTLADTAEIIKSAKGGNETILLVEDNEGLLKLTAGILRNYGYAVIEANNPGQALLIAEKQKSSIKMLFTDILMPEMDGLELAKKIALISKDIRVLYFSGFTDFSLMPEGIIDKKISYLQKPFTTQELLTSVRKVLDVEKGKKTT